MTQARTNLKNLTREQLRAWVGDELGEKPFRATQLFRWIWLRGATDFESMTDLGKALRDRLTERATLPAIEARRLTPATDGTVKVLAAMPGGATVETVWIPDWGHGSGGERPADPGQRPARITMCISTQYGCAYGCRFCYTRPTGSW